MPQVWQNPLHDCGPGWLRGGLAAQPEVEGEFS